MPEDVVLLFQCPDRRGIVANLTELVFRHGGNITRSDQYTTDPEGGRFFMRLEFRLDHAPERAAVERDVAALATELDAGWRVHFKRELLRMAVAVSRYDHCLVDLLYRAGKGELRATIPCVVSNHDDMRPLVERHDIPFYHLPVAKETKTQQEKQVLEIIRDASDFLVLARYMQILSADFLRAYGKDVINIHHSFLPSFKGASPYRQAYERGVKLIGATAHYATTDLDEGPIIEQVVGRVTHKDTIDTLQQKGRNLEQRALAGAIEAHTEHRVIRFANKTIVFE